MRQLRPQGCAGKAPQAKEAETIVNAMTNPPKLGLYAVAKKVPAGIRNITPGKHYEVLYDYGAGFAFVDDTGTKVQSLWRESYQLRGGNWSRSKLPAPPKPNDEPEVVAWLYEREVDGVLEVRTDHMRWVSWVVEGWMETPLIRKPKVKKDEE